MNFVPAAESGIKKLYHYEKFCPKWLENTLANQQIHVSNPQTFNDPWDCHAYYDTSRAGDPAYRASCIERIRSVRLHSEFDRPLEGETRLQEDGDLFTKYLRTTFSEQIRELIAKRWRVYCLTTDCDNSLMWSHYSNGHQGICLEFDTGQTMIGGAFKVEYSESLSLLDILSTSDEDAVQILLTKSSDWSNEKEYRILAREGEAVTNGSLLLQPNALTGIIAGCRADVDTIKTLVDKRAPGLPVKRAVQAPDRYRLSIQD